jgi:hypothetical protein
MAEDDGVLLHQVDDPTRLGFGVRVGAIKGEQRS